MYYDYFLLNIFALLFYRNEIFMQTNTHVLSAVAFTVVITVVVAMAAVVVVVVLLCLVLRMSEPIILKSLPIWWLKFLLFLAFVLKRFPSVFQLTLGWFFFFADGFGFTFVDF